MAIGAGAEVIKTTPQPNTPYKIRCIATDHSGYLGDNGTTLQGRHATGTFFILEPTGTNGQYYLKSEKTGKYINAASTANGAEITFDTEHRTYWTVDQTLAQPAKFCWAIRPNGTSGRSLNNNGSNTATCPYMKVNNHNSNTQGCNLWTFETEMFGKPAFGGTVWTWNTGTRKFDASGQNSTPTPGRRDSKGPVYKFVDAGTVTTAVDVNTDTSDDGGVWVVGGNTNITTSIGRWAGNILVEESTAIANVTFSSQIKNTEYYNTNAWLWTNGIVNINLGSSDKKVLDIDGGGKPIRWFIGENGMVNTAFTSTSNATNRWEIQVVVADMPQVGETDTRTRTTIKKQVVTWGANLSSKISSLTVWYKNAEGVYTKLDNNTAVTYDASGITITYEGLGYDEKYPSLDVEKYITYNAEAKASFLETATSADDNAHWYVMTQERGGETPMYDNSIETLKRAAMTDRNNGIRTNVSKKYLVRFFPTGTDGQYYIQFGTGKFIKPNLTTGSVSEAAAFKVYKVNNEDGRIGWNRASDDQRVDNNGAGNTLAYWGSGQAAGDNNVWAIYPVEFTDPVTVNYTLRANTSEAYTGSYTTIWAYNQTTLPTFSGATDYRLSNAIFTKSGESYTATMDVTFPFPVSSATVKNPTGINSEFSPKVYWRAKQSETNYIASSTNTLNNITDDNVSEFQWYIYPTLTDGVFSFKIQNKNTSLFMPKFGGAKQDENTTNNLVAEGEAGSFYYMPCNGTGKGFSINTQGTIFMSVTTARTDNQSIWSWEKSGTHVGSNLAFPDIVNLRTDIITKFNKYVAVTPLDVLEGSTVVGPDEFRNPTVINAAITAAQAIAADDMQAKYNFNTNATQGQAIQTYLDAVATYGALYNYQFTANYQYGTIILPCPSTKPTGLTFYSCTVGEDGVLILTNAGNMVHDTPYIYEQDSEAAINKYTIIGWDKGGRDTYSDGTNCLRGTLKADGERVPEYSYVLAVQKSNGRQGFFRTDGSVICPQHRCYLTAPSSTTAPKAFYFDNQGETTSIETIFGNGNERPAIYDLSGKRLNRLQKGVNIVNGHKVIVK